MIATVTAVTAAAAAATRKQERFDDVAFTIYVREDMNVSYQLHGRHGDESTHNRNQESDC